MKRRYREGDWFAVPLQPGRTIVGVIARQDRSRLFGYFFAPPALREEEALWRGCFAGDGIEDARWSIFAHAPDSEPREFSRAPSAAELAAMPSARFESAALVEARLRGLREGLAVRELRSPLDASELARVPPAGRVQFGSPLTAQDVGALAALLSARPDLELRVHGFSREPFDATVFAQFRGLRRLVLDVRVPSLEVLTPLTATLESLALGRRAGVPFEPPELPRLTSLELHHVAIPAFARSRLPALCRLALVDTVQGDLEPVASLANLESLVVRYGACSDAAAIPALSRLQFLELRGLRELGSLPPLDGLAALRSIVLAALPRIVDLRALATAPALESVEVFAMGHLGVNDLDALREVRRLCHVSVDIGGRRKNREVYRRLAARA